MVAVADIVVQSPDNGPQLIVEVKNKVPSSAQWAAKMRRNLFAHFPFPNAPFFLLALPERFYLWKNAPTLAETPPDFEIDAEQLLTPYLNHSRLHLSQLSEANLEILVLTWLEHVVYSSPDELTPAEEWVTESGLYDAIKQGTVRTRVAS